MVGSKSSPQSQLGNGGSSVVCCGESGLPQTEGGISISEFDSLALNFTPRQLIYPCIHMDKKQNACIDYSPFLNLKVTWKEQVKKM